MNNGIHLPGFPSPEKQGDVDFYLLKNLSYSKRIKLYFFLLFAGFSLQILLLSPWPGLPFLLFATILILVRGYDSRRDIKAFYTSKEWTEVDIDKIVQVITLDDKIKKWDKDILDISNAAGVGTFVLITIGLFGSSVVLPFIIGFNVTSILVADAVILLLPMWFNGMRLTSSQETLRIKSDIVIKIEKFFQNIKKEGQIFKPNLMLSKNKSGSSFPTDTRFTISFKDMPKDFYGIQAQINVNLIEGSNYPYFYCVIPAKLGFGLESHINKIPKANNIIIEFQKDDKAEVLVIRQFTTKTSGYHTKIIDCQNILQLSLTAAEIILQK